MRLEQLRYIIISAECKSFNKACNSLFITPQALNRSIATFEKEIGVSIFERFSTGIQLTEAGKEIVAMAKRIVNDYENTLKKVNTIQSDNEAQRIYLYIHSSYAAAYFYHIVNRFNKSKSEIRVTLNEYNNFSASWMLEHIDDPAPANWMLFTNVNVHNNALITTPLFQKSVVVPSKLDGSCIACVNKRHLLAGQKTVSLKILAQYPLVRFSSGVNEAVNETEACLSGYQTETAFTTNDVSSWIDAIAEDIGVGIALDVIARNSAKTRELVSKVKTLQISEDTRYQSCFILPPNHLSAVDTFVDFALSELKTYA